ncbi:hypothetical protein SPSYN_02830 [Sporotomaculum syntrophicum]|uniref:Uncharacterized protein n=1 Tax=Sporotomaculum syntrophicum TaxID=182264 RepID=A0A9D2WMH6_9FIRM|nr:hypothetical protein [Sporotomaculum syntrophicum]KAF1083918.1 hypothetical protein SPSYN_02830 [Sporotomaculum syntrophicum]
MNLVPRQARQAGQYHRTSFETLIKPPGRVLMLHRCLVVFWYYHNRRTNDQTGFSN